MSTESALARDVKFLKRYALVSSAAVLGLVVSSFAQHAERTRFEEIDVERINVVEKDGQLRLVISNRDRQHPGVVDGKPMPRPHGRPPGLLFFNHRGDECGGLVFDENGGKGHFVSLTFDKSRQDQTLGLQHLESDDGSYFAGLMVWDRPHTSLADFVEEYRAVEKMPAGPARSARLEAMQERGEFGTQRIAVGKLRDEAAMILLSDPDGRPRIRMAVDEKGTPRLDFLEEDGEVTLSLP